GRREGLYRTSRRGDSYAAHRPRRALDAAPIPALARPGDSGTTRRHAWLAGGVGGLRATRAARGDGLSRAAPHRAGRRLARAWLLRRTDALLPGAGAAARPAAT